MSRRKPLPRIGGNGPAARGDATDLGDVNHGWKSGDGLKIPLVCGGRPGEDCGRLIATFHFRFVDLPDGSRDAMPVITDRADVSPDGQTALPCGENICAGCGITLGPVSMAVLGELAHVMMKALTTRRQFLWQNVAAVQ